MNCASLIDALVTAASTAGTAAAAAQSTYNTQTTAANNADTTVADLKECRTALIAANNPAYAPAIAQANTLIDAAQATATTARNAASAAYTTWQNNLTLQANQDAAAAALSPTTATAGTPGSFSPAGRTIPTTLAQANDWPIVASPTSAWTTGQRVLLSGGSPIHWNGTAFAAGAAS